MPVTKPVAKAVITEHVAKLKPVIVTESRSLAELGRRATRVPDDVAERRAASDGGWVARTSSSIVEHIVESWARAR